MSHFRCLSICVAYLLVTACQAQQPKASAVETTMHFEFYINKWLNLHHFLFQSAKTIARDSSQSMDHFPHWQHLDTQEQAVVMELMKYYQTTWIDKNLLFNKELYRIKSMITYWGNDLEVVDEQPYTDLVQYWQAFTPIYDRYFWPKQLAQNKEVLGRNLARIRGFEEAATKRLSGLCQEAWPSDKVRVDVTYLADWAGAYTTTNPVHIVTSTQVEGPEGDWVETLFHEASHKLISSRRGAVTKTIESIAAAEGLKIPRQLWHAVLFYFAGKTIQDLLAEEGVDYELYMRREKVFSDYYPALESSMTPYLEGKSTLEESLRQLMLGLQ